jgi:hypothetical protein
LAQDYCNNVEAKGSIINLVRFEKKTGGSEQSCFLGRCDGGLDGTESFVCPGSDLDKDEGPVGINHNQVDFTGLAGEVSGEGF